MAGPAGCHQDPKRQWASRTAKSLTLALVSSCSRPVPGRALGLCRCRLLLLLLRLLLQEHLLLEGRLVTSPLLPILACQGSSIPTSRPAATIAKACRQKATGSEQGLSSGGRRPAPHSVRQAGSSPGCPYPMGRCTCIMPPDTPPPPGIPAYGGQPVMMGYFWLSRPRD